MGGYRKKDGRKDGRDVQMVSKTEKEGNTTVLAGT
jgi:hypothetical protein